MLYPFLDDTGRFEVDPIEHYGVENIELFLTLAEQKMNS